MIDFNLDTHNFQTINANNVDNKDYLKDMSPHCGYNSQAMMRS